MIKLQIVKNKSRRKSMATFSKKVIVALTVLWFFGALFGTAAVTLQLLRCDMTVQLSDLLLYIGAPMTGGIVGYMLKSAYENKEKIKNSGIPQEDNSI